MKWGLLIRKKLQYALLMKKNIVALSVLKMFNFGAYLLERRCPGTPEDRRLPVAEHLVLNAGAEVSATDVDGAASESLGFYSGPSLSSPCGGVPSRLPSEDGCGPSPVRSV